MVKGMVMVTMGVITVMGAVMADSPILRNLSTIQHPEWEAFLKLPSTDSTPTTLHFLALLQEEAGDQEVSTTLAFLLLPDLPQVSHSQEAAVALGMDQFHQGSEQLETHIQRTKLVSFQLRSHQGETLSNPGDTRTLSDPLTMDLATLAAASVLGYPMSCSRRTTTSPSLRIFRQGAK